jgi:hypothetical protein
MKILKRFVQGLCIKVRIIVDFADSSVGPMREYLFPSYLSLRNSLFPEFWSRL